MKPHLFVSRCCRWLVASTRLVPAMTLVATLSVASTASGAAAARKSFDVPAGPAERALKQLSAQAGVEVLFATETAADVRTHAVTGEFAPLEAAQRMLAGTNLTATQDAASGALVVARAEPPRAAVPPAPRRPAPSAAEVETDPNAPHEMQPVEVTGSRIRSLLGEATIQPTMILSSEEIERSGATTLAEAFRYVPEISSYTEGEFIQSPNAFGASSGDATAARVSVTLRGAPAGGTLLLINGRRAPKNGQETSQADYDLSGIPLAAIERVEVLLDGASAIYGNDAVGGVVNVILKRGYRRTDFKIGYQNTFDGDAHVFTASVVHGFAHGKLSGTITLSNEQSGSLMWVDRNFLRTQDRRQWGGTNNPAAQIPSANGTVSLTAGNTLGLPAGTLLTIPRGSTGSNKTAADFAAAGSPPAPPGTDLAIWAAYNSPYERRSVVANFEYDLKAWLTAFVELRSASSHTEQTATPLAVSSITIPAGAPGNVFGVPVTMRRYLTDLPIAARWSQTNNVSGTIGLRAQLPHDWRVEGSLSHVNTRPEWVDPLGFSISASRLTTALADPSQANRPNLFYDASTPGLDPNAPGLLASLGTGSRSLESDYTTTYSVQGDGPVAKLWAGDLRAAVGSEYREEHVRFPLAAPGTGTRPRTRYVTGVFAELRLPLLSDQQHLPLVNRLEVTVAGRHDHYQEFKGATKPRYGAMYRPFTWLMFRASRGEGYKLPTLNQLYAPVTTTTGTIGGSGLIDIYRGGEAYIGNQILTIGGNPNLVPEESKTDTAGVVLDVPGKWFKGWSASWSFYDYKYSNRISPSLSLADRLLVFPDLFVRAPASAADLAKGWPGPFTNPLTYDNRAVNVSINRITGWDAGTKYYRATPIGTFTVSYNASKTYRNLNLVRPGAPPATNAVPQALPLKESGSLFWRKGAFETGGLFSYRDEFKSTLTQRPTPSAIRWDWNGSIDLAQTKWARYDAERWYQRWLADTRISVTIFNVFDRNPPMNASGLPDSSIIDALGERFSLSVTKSFNAGAARRRN